jgi:hypothetical protein
MNRLEATNDMLHGGLRPDFGHDASMVAAS